MRVVLKKQTYTDTHTQAHTGKHTEIHTRARGGGGRGGGGMRIINGSGNVKHAAAANTASRTSAENQFRSVNKKRQQNTKIYI